jgi:uncharacterized protein YacL
LTNLRRLQDSNRVNIAIEQIDAHGEDVDQALLSLAADKNFRIVTTDFNLARVAEIRDVQALNLNDLTGLMQGHVIPGESIRLEIIRSGDSEGQGVGYLPDGTMVVVEQARSHIGEQVMVVISNTVQTSAGRLVFARLEDAAGETAQPARTVGDAATSQPRHVSPPERKPPNQSGRNPRR